jgi:magnesium chelatase family protein
VKLGAGAGVNADAEGALLDEIATPDAAGKSMLLPPPSASA